MQTSAKIGVLGSIILVFFFGGIASAQDFSADMVSLGGLTTSKMFVAKEKTRTEMQAGGQQSITITRIDKNVVWILMPEQKTYMEQSLKPEKPEKPENIAATTDKMPGEVEQKRLGTETVDGRKTEKYRTVYTEGNKKTTTFQWVDTDLGYPIKMAVEDEDGKVMVLMEYKNLKLGKQPDALFEIPEGYKKVSSFGIGTPFGIPSIPETKPEERPAEKKQEEPKKPLIPNIPKIPKLW